MTSACSKRSSILMEGLKHTRQEHVLNPLLTSQTARGINWGRLINLQGLSFVSLLTSWEAMSSDIVAGHRLPHITAADPNHPCARSWGQKKIAMWQTAAVDVSHQARSRTWVPASAMPSLASEDPEENTWFLVFPFPFRIPKFWFTLHYFAGKEPLQTCQETERPEEY